IEPWFAVAPPPWIRRNLDHLEHPYAILRLGNAVRPFAPKEFPYGANMAFWTRILKENPFNPRLGPLPNDPPPGEEIEVLQRVRKRGHQGVWVGPARVRHYIVAERLTGAYIWGYYRGYGKSEMRLTERKDWKLFRGVPRWLWKQYWRARLQSWC